MDVTISELAELVARVTGFQGRLTFDRTKPDGTPRKVLDVGFIRSLGWEPRIGLEEVLAAAYRSYCENRQTARKYGVKR